VRNAGPEWTVVAHTAIVRPALYGSGVKRVVVLASGAGSNLRALLAADLGAEVVLVVSDRADAGALRLAGEAGIGTAVVPLAGDRAAWDARLIEAVAAARPDLVVLAGFMRVLGAEFVRRFPTLNVHPSLLPAFPGAHAVAEALAWGVRVSGATVHLVDELVDHGPVVAQEAVTVEPDDTVETLHVRIKAVEHRLLPACVALFCADRLAVDGRHVKVLPA
jgi:phosphoribosylglycinamide formyltransferase-1